MFVFYFGHKLVRKTKVVPLVDVPIRPFIDIADANPETEPKRKTGPLAWFGRFWWD
jgi:amino acid transporter